ncbi:MAG: RNA methyltransferase [Thermoanaerobacteraceae bacterium]|nr:RNA methyltransferase [Thermoanaerobacteraceae bacterium]
MRRAKVYLALLHYPVYNKKKEIITTSVTNLDIHDIARCAATYQLEGYYIVQPLDLQRQMVKRIIDYWQSGQGYAFNPDRQKAFEKVMISRDLSEMIDQVTAKEGCRPKLIATDARKFPNTVTYRQVRESFSRPGVYILLFGTGWGIARDVMAQVDWILEPIYGAGDYNHLSVRSAVAIILDRLCGEKWW